MVPNVSVGFVAVILAVELAVFQARLRMKNIAADATTISVMYLLYSGPWWPVSDNDSGKLSPNSFTKPITHK